MSEPAAVTVSENTDQGRYEAVTDAGVVAGFAEFVDRDGARVLTHTEVDDAFEGEGLGTALASGALDDVRERGMAVVVRCPFITSFIEKHPEYADLQR